MNFNHNDQLKMKMKMKKMNLLMSALAVTLLMTSCLGDGNRNYTEKSVVYIDKDPASVTMYGKTLTGRLITSNGMQLMDEGSFKIFTYSWDEAYGTTLIGQTPVDNVVIGDDPVDVDRTVLKMSELPDDDDTDLFLAVDKPYYVNHKTYLGDYWLFQYAYEAGKDDEAEVEFYLVNDSNPDDDEVLIEIRLDIDKESETGASVTTKTDIVAVNMRPLRSYFEGLGQSKRELKISFQYYQKDRTDPVKLDATCTLTVGEES